MTCPRCSIGELDKGTGKCTLCGFVPGATVTVDKPVVDEVQETVQRELEGQFKINVLLRHGSRSAVYLADEVGTNRLVALKVIPLQRDMNPDLAQFEREAGIAASLSHAHIVPILGFGKSQTMLWYSMEYIKGRSLADILRDSERLDLETCQKILEQVASALDYMHRRNVTHGNVKPSNILVNADRWAMVSDPCVMGAIRPTTPHGAPRVLSGTPEYMAPEQFWTRSPGASADQYALAVVAYECLSGTLPFIGDSPEEMEKLHRTEVLKPLSDLVEGLPTHVGQAVLRALGKTPAVRFATVLDFVAMLRKDWAPHAVQGLAPESRPSTPSRVFVIEKPRRGLPLKWILGLAAVIAVAGGLLRFWPGDSLQWSPPATGPRTAAEVAASDEATTQPGPEAPATDNRTARVRDPGRTQSADSRPTSTPTSRPAQRAAPPPATQPTEARTTTAPTRQAPVEPGRLFINSTPWGQVYIDDELIGNTPQVLTIAAGTHSLRVVRDGFLPFESEVQIAPGQQRRITDIVLRVRQP